MIITCCWYLDSKGIIMGNGSSCHPSEKDRRVNVEIMEQCISLHSTWQRHVGAGGGYLDTDVSAAGEVAFEQFVDIQNLMSHATIN